MSKLNLRPATVEDCAELAITLRKADLKELALGGAETPYGALLRSMGRSAEPLVALAPDGSVAAMGGVVQLAPNLGSPWLLASDSFAALKWPFLRECKRRLLEIQAQFPLLYNEVWEGNTVHINWLKWLGFTVGAFPTARPHFLPFWRTNV